jgi:hypothetical protein
VNGDDLACPTKRPTFHSFTQVRNHMGDFLTERHGVWQFVRRVPLEYSKLDPRGVIKHSTKMPVAKDRRGIKAGRIAEAMNRDLETYWRGLEQGNAQEARDRYDETRRRARVFRFDDAETHELADPPALDILERLEKLEKLVSTSAGRGRRRLKIKK